LKSKQSAPPALAYRRGMTLFTIPASLNMTDTVDEHGRLQLLAPALRSGDRHLYLDSNIEQFMEEDYAQECLSTHRAGSIFKSKVPLTQLMTWQKVHQTSIVSL
jgi:hypothetical protein